MANNLELLSLKCASCGAAFDDFQGRTEVKCDFCGNVTKILRPIKVSANTSKLAESDTGKFNNLIAIMEKSMIAGNYKEAYDYCNKALEIDPDSSALWENKAISSFWLRSDSEIIESEAKEILTYLNAAKQSESTSPTYEATANSLASNLFFAVYYRYLLKRFDYSTDGKTKNAWTSESIKQIISYLNIMDLCFNISPSTLYLETAIEELSNRKKVKWFKVSRSGFTNAEWLKSFDAVKSREKYINKLQAFNPNYIPPDIKHENKDFWYTVLGWFVLIIAGIIFIKACN
jgi:tetratricopeptide (TPR) repeat protein